MSEKTFREGNIHDDVYWSPKQKEDFILKHYKNNDRKELDKTAKEISDAIRVDERTKIRAKVEAIKNPYQEKAVDTVLGALK